MLQQQKIQAGYLRIRLMELEILHSNPVIESYYSITYNQQVYFSSVFDEETILEINSDIIIALDQSSVEKLKVSFQRWESHVVVFDEEIELAQLKTKSLLKRKYEAKKSQYVTMMMSLISKKDIVECKTLVDKTSQHFLLLSEIKMKEEKGQQRGDYGPCYFQINNSKNTYNIPVMDGNCLISLPDTFEITHYKNGKFHSKSKLYSFQQLNNFIQGVEMFNESDNSVGKVSFVANWLIDYTVHKSAQYLLAHTTEVLLFQFEIKFQMPSDVLGAQLRVHCNNKLFQFNDELGHSKLIRLKKAVWVICKNQNDIVQVKLERNSKILSKIDLLVRDILISSELIKFKSKLEDQTTGKSLGHIKFNVQKSMGNPHPQNSSFWKNCVKKKCTSSLMLEQVSVYYGHDETLALVVKTENQQKTISKLSNVNFYEEESMIYHPSLTFNHKPEETVYFMLKRTQKDEIHDSGDDFLGIGVLNVSQLKIGRNCCEVDFYKNQEKLGTVNCLIHRFLGLNFLKSIFQPQILPIDKEAEIKLSLNVLILSPFFFTYRYEQKSEVFCIIELNRLKKVLILQPTFEELSFIPSTSSDRLSFAIDVDEFVKLKITIMVGDGMLEEIYGTGETIISMHQLKEQHEVTLKGLKFENYAKVDIGSCDLKCQFVRQTLRKIEKSKSKEKISLKSRNRSSKSQKEKKQSNSIIEHLPSSQKEKNQVKAVKRLLPHYQRKRDHNFGYNKKQSFDSSFQPSFLHDDRETVKLPIIKQKKQKDNLTDLFTSMNMRKRTKDGYDYRKPVGDKSSKQLLVSRSVEKSKAIDFNDLLENSPNMDRNFELLFPVKKGVSREQQIKYELNRYQEKLKGLKSVLSQISSDIGPIEPSIREGQGQSNTDSLSRKEQSAQNVRFQYAGNQFL